MHVPVPEDVSGRGLCSDALTPARIAGVQGRSDLHSLRPGENSGNKGWRTEETPKAVGRGLSGVFVGPTGAGPRGPGAPPGLAGLGLVGTGTPRLEADSEEPLPFPGSQRWDLATASPGDVVLSRPSLPAQAHPSPGERHLRRALPPAPCTPCGWAPQRAGLRRLASPGIPCPHLPVRRGGTGVPWSWEPGSALSPRAVYSGQQAPLEGSLGPEGLVSRPLSSPPGRLPPARLPARGSIFCSPHARGPSLCSCRRGGGPPSGGVSLPLRLSPVVFAPAAPARGYIRRGALCPRSEAFFSSPSRLVKAQRCEYPGQGPSPPEASASRDGGECNGAGSNSPGAGAPPGAIRKGTR